jgi:AraC family transcriptional regulator
MIHFIQGEQIMEVAIKEMQELRVATISHVGPYNRISEAFARLGELAGAAGLLGPEAAMLAIYHDDPETTPASELRSEAGRRLGSLDGRVASAESGTPRPARLRPRAVSRGATSPSTQRPAPGNQSAGV